MAVDNAFSFSSSELDYLELLTVLFLSTNDAVVADGSKDQTNELGAGEARIEEDVPLAVLLKELSSVCLGRVPLYDIWEEDLIKGKEARHAKG